jgi:hypothetical protein
MLYDAMHDDPELRPIVESLWETYRDYRRNPGRTVIERANGYVNVLPPPPTHLAGAVSAPRKLVEALRSWGRMKRLDFPWLMSDAIRSLLQANSWDQFRLTAFSNSQMDMRFRDAFEFRIDEAYFWNVGETPRAVLEEQVVKYLEHRVAVELDAIESLISSVGFEYRNPDLTVVPTDMKRFLFRWTSQMPPTKIAKREGWKHPTSVQVDRIEDSINRACRLLGLRLPPLKPGPRRGPLRRRKHRVVRKKG